MLATPQSLNIGAAAQLVQLSGNHGVNGLRTTTGGVRGNSSGRFHTLKRGLSDEYLQEADLNRPLYVKKPKRNVKPCRALKWTKEEDVILVNAMKKYGEKNWRSIAEEVPGRDHLQCLQRWKKALQPGLVKGHWGPEEDTVLLDIIKTYLGQGKPDEDGKIPEKKEFNWVDIASHLPGRSSKQCRERWCLNLDPSINRGPWTPEEDAQLLELEEELGGRWSILAKKIPGRTENSVKARFHSLQRKQAKSRGWTQQDDNDLVALCLQHGTDSWNQISKLMPCRSKGQLKKRYLLLERRKPELQIKIQENLKQQNMLATLVNRNNTANNIIQSAQRRSNEMKLENRVLMPYKYMPRARPNGEFATIGHYGMFPQASRATPITIPQQQTPQTMTYMSRDLYTSLYQQNLPYNPYMMVMNMPLCNISPLQK